MAVFLWAMTILIQWFFINQIFSNLIINVFIFFKFCNKIVKYLYLLYGKIKNFVKVYQQCFLNLVYLLFKFKYIFFVFIFSLNLDRCYQWSHGVQNAVQSNINYFKKLNRLIKPSNFLKNKYYSKCNLSSFIKLLHLRG